MAQQLYKETGLLTDKTFSQRQEDSRKSTVTGQSLSSRGSQQSEKTSTRMEPYPCPYLGRNDAASFYSAAPSSSMPPNSARRSSAPSGLAPPGLVPSAPMSSNSASLVPASVSSCSALFLPVSVSSGPLNLYPMFLLRSGQLTLSRPVLLCFIFP